MQVHQAAKSLQMKTSSITFSCKRSTYSSQPNPGIWQKNWL